MGVRGLTTFVSNHANRLLKDTRLKQQNLVIDGDALIWYLVGHYRIPHWCGGDCSLMYDAFTGFFSTLQKCELRCVVVFD